MRREFSVIVRRLAKARAGKNCEGCGLEFGGMRPEYHHKKEDTYFGDPVLENCQVLCPPCHRTITKARQRDIARSNRVRNKANGTTKVKRKIPSRGFG
jgi:5-methylcytosine-specific restriction protein A